MARGDAPVGHSTRARRFAKRGDLKTKGIFSRYARKGSTIYYRFATGRRVKGGRVIQAPVKEDQLPERGRPDAQCQKSSGQLALAG